MPAVHAWGYTGFMSPDGFCWTADAEARLGAHFDASSVYAKIDGPGRFKATQEDVAAMTDRHGFIYLVINTATVAGGFADPIDITTGLWDTQLLAWSQQILPFVTSGGAFASGKLLITYAHEPTINSQQNNPTNWTPANYKAAFRYVHDYIENYLAAHGGASLRWVFAPVVANYEPANLGGPNGADTWYPGDDLIEIMGADIYEHSNTGPGKTLAVKFANQCAFADTHAKKTGVFEIGVDGTPAGSPDAKTQVTEVCAAMLARTDLICVLWTVEPTTFGLATTASCPTAKLADTPFTAAWLAGSAGFGFGV